MGFWCLVLLQSKQSLAHCIHDRCYLFYLYLYIDSIVLLLSHIVCLSAWIYAWSGFRAKQLRDCDAIGGTLWPRGCHIQSVTATVDHAGTFVPAGVSSTGDLLLQVVAIAVMSAVIISLLSGLLRHFAACKAFCTSKADISNSMQHHPVHQTISLWTQIDWSSWTWNIQQNIKHHCHSKFRSFPPKWVQIGRTSLPLPWPLLLAPWPWHAFGRHRGGDGRHRRCSCRVPWLWWWAWLKMRDMNFMEFPTSNFCFICIWSQSLWDVNWQDLIQSMTMMKSFIDMFQWRISKLIWILYSFIPDSHHVFYATNFKFNRSTVLDRVSWSHSHWCFLSFNYLILIRTISTSGLHSAYILVGLWWSSCMGRLACNLWRC